MNYFIVAKTVQTYAVEAENEAAAIEMVNNQLLRHNPQQLIELTIAEEVEFDNPADSSITIESEEGQNNE